jgi:xanthine dehydrogenase accessory factor
VSYTKIKMSFALPDWPLFGLTDDVRPALAQAMANGQDCALVTLYAVAGGGPRPPGTQMAITATDAAGFLSGGCVEGDIIGHAMATLEDGKPRHLVYGDGGPWPDIRLLCGARIDVLVERVKADDPAARKLIDLRDARIPALWRTDGVTRTCEAATGGELMCSTAIEPFSLTRRHDPIWRLAVVGGDPTALAIATVGAQSGLDTTLIRPKGPTSAPPLPGVAYRRDNAGEALAAIGLDPWTAVAVATHDMDIDQDALVAALPSPARYVGLLGARARLPERLARLEAAGVSRAQLARLKAPIGLPTGGKAPWEVAVSVIGEIMAERNSETI